MGTVRPSYNNWSAGAITPKLFGQVSSPIFASGAKVMKNVNPQLFGSWKRRGGLKKIAQIAGVTGKCRLIPWSVNNDIDLLVLLSDGRIDLFDVSYGHSNASFILSITSLGTGLASYTEAEISKVNYAIGIGTMYMAHQNHQLFQIKFTGYTAGTPDVFTFSYGTIELTGSIAYTPEEGLIVTGGTSTFTAAQFLSRVSVLPSGSPITASGTIDGKTITSITKTITDGTPASIEVYITSSLFFVVTVQEDYIFMDGGAVGATIIYNTLIKSSAKSATLKEFTDPYTKQNLFDAIEALGLSDHQSVYIEYNHLLWTSGRVKFHNAVEKVETYTVTFSDLTTRVINSTTPLMTGYVRVVTPEIKLNDGESTSGGSVSLDCLVPWMVAGVSYPCIASIPFCGIYPMSAVKIDGDAKVDQSTGVVTGQENESLCVSGFDGITNGVPTGSPMVRYIKRGDEIWGQLGVIVNPFVGVGKNPAFVAFHNGQMVVGGSLSEPNVLYASKVNDYANFCYFEEIEYEKNTIRDKPWTNPNIPEYDVRKAIVQQVGQDSAWKAQLLTDESEALIWASSVGDLVVGTSTSEWVIPGSCTAQDLRAILTSRNGSGPVQGRFVKGSILFASGNLNRLHMFQATQGEVTDSIMGHAEHLFRAHGSIVSFDFRQDPYQGILVTMSDGTVIHGMMNDSAIGFSEIVTRSGDLIESMVSIATGDEDAVYAVVDRLGDGGARVKTLERLMTTDDTTAVYTDRVYLDSYESFAASAGSVVVVPTRFMNGTAAQTGLWVAMAGGGSGVPTVSTIGQFSAYVDAYGVSHAVGASETGIIGYRYESLFNSLRVDSAELDGLMKSPGNVRFRVDASGNFWLKRMRATDVNPVLVATPVDEVSGARVYPYTGTLNVLNPSSAAVDQEIIVATDTHEPLTVQMITPFYSVGEQP